MEAQRNKGSQHLGSFAMEISNRERRKKKEKGEGRAGGREDEKKGGRMEGEKKPP